MSIGKDVGPEPPAALKWVGPYRVLQELPRGGMGHLLLAIEARLQRRVVLKLLSPALSNDESSRRRFELESNALASLNHPNIVTIHALEEVDGKPVLVMEWIDGCRLSELIPPGGLPLERCLDVLLPVTKAVAAAHQVGIIHRDLNPKNVVVRWDGVPKVVDFGLAKREQNTMAGPKPAAEALTEQGVVVGTVPYMAPEQVEARPSDHRSDIYALGVMLFEMVTGRRPFVASSDASMISAILRDQPPHLPAINAALPRQLDAIVQRCLAKDPSQRYPDALALHQALSALRASSSSGTPAVAAATAARLVHRSAWAAAAALLLLALAGAAVGWRWLPSPARADGTEGGLAGASSPSESAPARATIAVLPMRNLSNNATYPEQESFVVAATEAITAALAEVSALRVTALGPTMPTQRAAATDSREIARTLRVRFLVQGSVLRVGGRVAIAVHLIEPGTEQELWGEVYHGSLADILGFERWVALAVAGRVLGEPLAEDVAERF